MILYSVKVRSATPSLLSFLSPRPDSQPQLSIFLGSQTCGLRWEDLVWGTHWKRTFYPTGRGLPHPRFFFFFFFPLLFYKNITWLHESKTCTAWKFPGPWLENAKTYLSKHGGSVWRRKIPGNNSLLLWSSIYSSIRWYEVIYCCSGYLNHLLTCLVLMMKITD